MVLFGSRATDRHTASSDIDLLVVYADPAREDAYALVRTLLNIRGLEPHVYSSSEARVMASKLERMVRDGIAIRT